MHVDSSVICKGECVNFIIDRMIDVYSYSIDFGDGENFQEVLNYVAKTNDTAIRHCYDDVYNQAGQAPGHLIPILTIETSACSTWYDIVTPEVDIDVQIRNVVAQFDITSSDPRDTIGCGFPYEFTFTDQSTEATKWTWVFGAGDTIKDIQTTSHTYNSDGTYDILLFIENSNECKDTLARQVVVRPLPVVEIDGENIICLNQDSAKIYATTTGTGVPFTYVWSPLDNLTSITNDTVVVYPTVDMTSYNVEVTDNYLCTDNNSISINVRQAPILDSIFPNPLIEIEIGQSVNLYADYINGYWYQWTYPGSSGFEGQIYHVTPSQTTIYTITVYDQDSICPLASQSVTVIVINEEGTIDVPSAFTPGTGTETSIVKVRGKGIIELLEFKIFNRWGQIVFETTDINNGWDGTFKGKLQGMDSYAYIAKVRTENGEILSKEGYINLLR